jgi:3'(2'), 5'-bisphosphate nucleotidase
MVNDTKQYGLNISRIVDVAEKSGELIMEIYSQADFGTMQKDDFSPLTRADISSHVFIKENLEEFNPRLPVLSEESIPPSYKDRRSLEAYWLIDPLDGTKEFTKKIGEFTVNIALIVNGISVLGVVHAPVLNVTYYASNRDIL